MLTDIELIQKLDLFDGLNPRTIQKISQLCIVREFAAEDYLIRQGESGLGLYFITSGRVKIEVERSVEVPGEGVKPVRVVLNELTEGGVVGEFAIIDDKARSANVICLEDTRCLLLTRDSFSKLLKKHPEISLQMLKSLVARIRSTNERITQAGSFRSAQAPAAAPAPEETAPAASSSNPLDGIGAGIGAATERVTEMMPRPEDMIRMYSSTKDRVQNMVVGMFGTMYVVKAMTRFSMAMVGCPVRVSAQTRDSEVFETVIDDVKLVVFPSGRDQNIRIEAYADGEMSAMLFRQGQAEEVEAIRWRGPVREKETFELQVPADRSAKPHRQEGRPCRLVALTEPGCRDVARTGQWSVSRGRLRDGFEPADSPKGAS